MLRALMRSFSISVPSIIFSSPVSGLRVPRAAIAIQVFSLAWNSPRPAIQMGKKITSRDQRDAPKTTSTNATPTPTERATMPIRRRLRTSRGPMLMAEVSKSIRPLTSIRSERRQRLAARDAITDARTDDAYSPGGCGACDDELLTRCAALRSPPIS